MGIIFYDFHVILILKNVWVEYHFVFCGKVREASKNPVPGQPCFNPSSV